MTLEQRHGITLLAGDILNGRQDVLQFVCRHGVPIASSPAHPASSDSDRGTQVFIQKDPGTGNVILSRRPHSSWRSFFKLRDKINVPVPDDFMSNRGDEPPRERELF